MNQQAKAKYFNRLHVAGDPCVLYNAWDAGSARSVAAAGAKAIATGSASVASAHGFEDGQLIPLDLVEQITQRICESVELPVTIDFEGGYAESPAEVGANVARIIATGAVGINFEDQVVAGSGLYDVSTQCDRIAAIRAAANEAGIALFINARTDLFLQAEAGLPHAELIADAKLRANAYRDAGASGFFVPLLVDESLIGDLCQHCDLPVNVMMMDSAPSQKRLAELGVARISYGPGPFLSLMSLLKERATEVYAKVM